MNTLYSNPGNYCTICSCYYTTWSPGFSLDLQWYHGNQMLRKGSILYQSQCTTHYSCCIVEYSTTTITTASIFRPSSPYYIIDKKDLYMTPINYGLCSIELCHCFCTSIHSFVLIIYLTIIQSKSLPLLLFLFNIPFIWNALPGSILCVLCHVTFRSLLINHFW